VCLFVGQALQFAGCKTRALIDMPFGGTRVGPWDHVLRKGALYGAYTLHLIDLHLTHIQRLQSVQNAAARLIFNLRRCDHITDALVSLYWFRVPEGVIFKVATLTYRALHGSAPPYLASSFTCVADMPHRRRLRSASTEQLDVPICRR